MVHLGWHSPTSGLEGLTWAVECGYSCVARTRTPGVTLERGSFERFRGCTGEMIPRAPARGRRKASAFVEGLIGCGDDVHLRLPASQSGVLLLPAGERFRQSGAGRVRSSSKSPTGQLRSLERPSDNRPATPSASGSRLA